ncbi:SMODS domain-containing nucleotidyltransferase [Burkholderia stagnalis]|uniref:SMODS domain-containing nucleotidyltransferase n=1 Tax=Burkholderia stagnalis TaxID=1503054 RepID=UPI0012DA2F6D|nr:nucleotidyltransferase [Burkholderia stagnalis]
MSRLPPNSLFSLGNAPASSTQQGDGTSAAARLLNAAMPVAGIAGLGGLGAVVAPAQSAPQWIHLTKRFDTFLRNLELTELQIQDGLTKIYGVVSCLNAAYYGSNSPTDNAFLIGSWAKGTRVRPPRDVDLYFVLPIEVYNRFAGYAAGVNRQSALLQEVKAKLLASYPTSAIKGDGPVVLAGFTSYNVEIVPAFLYSQGERSYYVCDTKNGGSYMKTMPLHEIDVINASDARTSNNTRRLIRMLKAWQSCCSVPVKSFYLELLAIEFLDQCPWRNQDYFYYDWISRDFFKWMITKANTYLWAPGTYNPLWLGDAWKSRAESALARAEKACIYERANDMANAGDEWQKIYGTDIPKWV